MVTGTTRRCVGCKPRLQLVSPKRVRAARAATEGGTVVALCSIATVTAIGFSPRHDGHTTTSRISARYRPDDCFRSFKVLEGGRKLRLSVADAHQVRRARYAQSLHLAFRCSFECDEHKTGSWTATASMSTARASLTATRLENGRVLVVGGSSIPPELHRRAVRPATGTWIPGRHAEPVRARCTSPCVSPTGVCSSPAAAVQHQRGAVRPGDEQLDADREHERRSDLVHRDPAPRRPRARRRRELAYPAVCRRAPSCTTRRPAAGP